MGREPGIGPAQLTCPNTDTDHSDQSVPVLFAPLFLEDRHPPALHCAADSFGAGRLVLGTDRVLSVTARALFSWRDR